MDEDIKKQLEQLTKAQAGMQHVFAALHKSIDDILWYQKVQDVARLDKVVFCGPPPANTLGQPPQERGNPVKVHAYTFLPKDAAPGAKLPLLVYVHGGVHANFSSSSDHIIKELVQQGYAVISPDYRGSTGYGEGFYKLIDYGGLEVEDALAARDWMVENEPLVDPDRVGILGWSHGGLITLFNIFRYPEKYKAAYAGVPVSDLVARMGYKGPHYESLFAADYHIGKPARENVPEYRRRSPAWHADKLQTPLLIHTNTNDEDVNVLEVEHLIKSLQAAGKEFKHRIYEGAPGGHVFNRIDTKLAKESRREIYQFLASYLHPDNPLE